MYDLRHIKNEPNATSQRASTVPVVKYLGHVNGVSLRLGFDIAPDRSILAAGNLYVRDLIDNIAGDDHCVRLWSVHTGQRIYARISDNTFPDEIVGVQFSHKEDSGLWIAGQELQYWSV